MFECLREIFDIMHGVETFNHPTLNHDRIRVRDETLNHVSVRVIDSSPFAISSRYKVYVIRYLVIKCP